MKAGLWCVLHDSKSEAVEILKTGCRVWETSVENYVCYVPKMCTVQLLQSFAVILFFIFVLLFMHITGIV